MCILKWQLFNVIDGGIEESFGGGGGRGGEVGQSRWVFIICRLHLISYLMLLLLLEALEGEREQQRQRQPPTSLLLVPAPKMPEVVPAARLASPNLASDGTAAPGDGAEGGGTVAHPAAEDCRSAGEWQQTTGSGICFGRSLS